MGIIKRLIFWGVGLYAATFLFVVGFTYSWTNPDAPAQADVIICLGAGMDPDGTLHHSAIKRVETCAALYADGIAPRVHFTGGRGAPDGPAAGNQMALLAQSLGVPAEATSTENASHSTLQNAYYSQPMLADATRLMIVTEAFHLPRSVASFGIFGPHDLDIYMSEPIRPNANGGWDWRMIRREAAAIWFNALRVGVWHAGGWFGAEGRDAWLD